MLTPRSTEVANADFHSKQFEVSGILRSSAGSLKYWKLLKQVQTMKTVYKAGNINEAHIVAGMLDAQGIEAHVGGHYLQGGVGEMSTMDFAQVSVADEDYDAALPLIKEYENEQPEYEEGDQPSNSALGIFSKPVLFWVALFLLVWWFLF